MSHIRHTGNISKEVNILDEIYLISNHHRVGNRKKSMWSINQQQELDIFKIMLEKEWYKTDEGWSLLRENNINSVLGESVYDYQTGTRRNLKVAMFEDSNNNHKWHGYPADYTNEQDRPPSNIFDNWVKNGLITKGCKRRFQNGKGDIK
ncbi:hypothetical protein IM538_14825 [Cytobacillus suaedae]|nr:hypothetical protein IM538_14825 [Cytobacillus suaedae]